MQVMSHHMGMNAPTTSKGSGWGGSGPSFGLSPSSGGQTDAVSQGTKSIRVSLLITETLVVGFLSKTGKTVLSRR